MSVLNSPVSAKWAKPFIGSSEQKPVSENFQQQDANLVGELTVIAACIIAEEKGRRLLMRTVFEKNEIRIVIETVGGHWFAEVGYDKCTNKVWRARREVL